jgi:hypothetical protein
MTETRPAGADPRWPRFCRWRLIHTFDEARLLLYLVLFVSIPKRIENKK